MLQGQLNSMIIERDSLKSQLTPPALASKAALDSWTKSPYAEWIKNGDDKIGLALKLTKMMKPVADIRSAIVELFPRSDKTYFHMVKGRGNCKDTNVPSNPASVSNSLSEQLVDLDE